MDQVIYSQQFNRARAGLRRPGIAGIILHKNGLAFKTSEIGKTKPSAPTCLILTRDGRHGLTGSLKNPWQPSFRGTVGGPERKCGRNLAFSEGKPQHGLCAMGTVTGTHGTDPAHGAGFMP